MPEFYYFKYFEKDSLANLATYDDAWTADEDLIIKRIYLALKSGLSFTQSTLYVKVGPDVKTRTIVPCVLLGADTLGNPELDIPFKNGVKMDFTLKNIEGAAISVMISFEVWK